MHDDGAAATHERSHPPEGGARKARKRRGPVGIVVILLVVALACAGLYLGVSKGVDWVQAQFGAAEDYSGAGAGEVLFEVKPGDSAAAIGRGLKEAGVVASVDAFINAATADSRSSGIQVGHYRMREQMSATQALETLLDPANQVRNTVTVPEGLRVVDIVDILVEKTDFGRGQFEKALDDPEALGLPDYAQGNPEGYLFPATYDVGPKDRPADILAAMVDRWRQAADDADLEGRADAMGISPAELMTVASLVEAEGRGDDMPKIARAIYNRLEPSNTETNGRLQIDATVNYALGRKGIVTVDADDRAVDSPYNTYANAGLPPTPIEAPGDDAISAAANPAEGPWLYWVTVNLATGETKFAETLAEHNVYVAEYREYCTTSDAC
ncbi:endolytic transglycosylase MltG [Nocardioides sp. Y6]|uniref:Endolytic murein transglycosylase n=1 Tax=Nocardioides malaquae TaxID=2773426 RepID=A0ABR9RS11_9ACTN|nr:endolytic transglycosylase MltG [Nocardioides malaquae]MBE7324333.1 endolytic transglycosylase MltG [Nocardioides malaquae]